MKHSKSFLTGLVAALAVATGAASPALAQTTAKKPNILVIWGDDIGQFNISAYNNGMMGYRTPNIDSIAKEGALFTDWRLGADYYFFKNAGLGVQYKYNRYSYDRGVLVSELGGEVTYKGFQVFVSFLF